MSKEESMSGIQEQTAVPNPAERQRGRQHIGKQARERLLAAMPVTERRLEVAGISTAVLQGGNGTPVVLLHGPGEYAAKWMRVIPDLVTTHRVVAPDLPGHGTTGVSDSPLDIDSVLGWASESPQAIEDGPWGGPKNFRSCPPIAAVVKFRRQHFPPTSIGFR
jgi:pimeloyl-ACP methyl ester carboxylesterase